jgi:6,7-dimethyl-8-ribityllumazine synthase
MAGKSPHVLIVEGRFYDEIADHLKAGAEAALKNARATYDVISVPGALEIPAVISLCSTSDQYDAFVALGCVIRGETSHYDIVAGESARALMDLSLDGHAIGNGILTCENKEQAIKRADPKQKNKGRDAVLAALALYDIRSSIEAQS